MTRTVNGWLLEQAALSRVSGLDTIELVLRYLTPTLLFALLFIEGRKWRYLGFFTFFCWAAIAVHPSVLPAIGLCMLGFGAMHVAANLRQRAAWTGMVALAFAMWSVVLGPAMLLFAGRSPAAVRI